jgi:lipoprotein-releasing system permease protein
VKFAFQIAIRYLFSKKKHQAVNLVSMVSVFGVATAVAALVCVLSVYNGFQILLSSMYSQFDPSIRIEATVGKTYNPVNEAFISLKKDKRIRTYCETLEENALVQYKNAQANALIKGVDSTFIELTEIEQLMVGGQFLLQDANFNYAVVGVGLAGILGTGGSFIDPITINTPRRTGSINLANPAASFTSIDILLSGSFSIHQAEYDNNLVLLPIELARSLFEYTNEVTAVEIKLKDGVSIEKFKKDASTLLGPSYKVLTLAEQKADIFRINQMEKWMTFLILSFILLLALFNVIGTLTMLILEKKEDAVTLSRLGANKQTIQSIFQMEGWLIAIFGAAIGIVLGASLCFIQQRFGLLKLGGGGQFIVDAYPVQLLAKDLLLVFGAVMLVGIPTTWWPVHAYLKKEHT